MNSVSTNRESSSTTFYNKTPTLNIWALNKLLPDEIKFKIIQGDITKFRSIEDVDAAVLRLRILYKPPLLESQILKIANWVSHHAINLDYFSPEEQDHLIHLVTNFNLIDIDPKRVSEILLKATNAKSLAIGDPNGTTIGNYLQSLHYPEKLRFLHLSMPELIFDGITNLDKLFQLKILDLRYCPKVRLTNDLIGPFLKKIRGCYRLRDIKFYKYLKDTANCFNENVKGIQRYKNMSAHQKAQSASLVGVIISSQVFRIWHTRISLLEKCCRSDFNLKTNSISLTVTDPQSDNLDYLAFYKHPAQVEEISLHIPNLTKEGISALRLFPNLKYVDFSACSNIISAHFSIQ